METAFFTTDQKLQNFQGDIYVIHASVPQSDTILIFCWRKYGLLPFNADITHINIVCS